MKTLTYQMMWLVLLAFAVLQAGCEEEVIGNAPPADGRAGAAVTLPAPSVARLSGEAGALQLVARSPAPYDQDVFLDQEILLTFDQPLDQDSVERSRSVVLMKAATGELVSLPVRVAEGRPNQIVLRPACPQTLEPDTDYLLVVSPGTVLGAGLHGESGAALREPFELRFRTGAAFQGFHALAVTPADGDDLWLSPLPTELTIHFSGAVDCNDLPRRLRGILYRVGSSPLKERQVLLRYLPDRTDPPGVNVLRLVTVDPLEEGTYIFRVAGFLSDESGHSSEGMASQGWQARFTVRSRETWQLELPPGYFGDEFAPTNLVSTAEIRGVGLHDQENLSDGFTAAEGGGAAWLRSEGVADPSQPSVEMHWHDQVSIAEIIVDTDSLRWNPSRPRVLSSYKVQVGWGRDEATGETLWRVVERQDGLTGGHVLVLDPPITTDALKLSHCRTKAPPGTWELANPVIYELAVHSEVGYSSRIHPFSMQLTLGEESDGPLSFCQTIVHGSAGGMAASPAAGAQLRYRAMLSAPGEPESSTEWLPAIPDLPCWQLQIEVQSDSTTGLPFDIQCVEFEASPR